MPKRKTNIELQAEVTELRKQVEMQGNRIDLSDKARTWLRLSQMGSAPTPYRSTTFSGTGRFDPGFPILPIDPETEPRLYQYGAGENLFYIPRAGYGLLSFPVLRNLSQLSKEIRLNIEKIKQILRGFEWDLIFEGPEVEVAGKTYQATPDLDRVKDFWDRPDGVHDFDAWISLVIEEILVTDALTLYPNEQDETFFLEVVDGATIRPLIDFHGKTPRHPAPAYLQILHGVPTSYYSAEGLMYLPRNPKVITPYGESPIEWIIQVIVQSIKHDVGRTNYFTEGNVPGAFAGLPDDWTVDQIQEFTEWFNAIIAGDTAKAYTLMFLPHSGSSLPIHQFNQADFSNPQLDEWLMTVACWAFGNSPSEFGLTRGDGLGGQGYMSAGENSQYRGLLGTAQFIKRVIDRVNKDFLQAPWAKFKWKDLDPVEDKTTEADVHLKYMGKVYTTAYVQDQLGIPEKYRVVESAPTDLAPGVTPGVFPEAVPPHQSAQLQPPQLQPEFSPLIDEEIEKGIRDDFKLWRKFAKDALRKNWQPKKFHSQWIPNDILDRVNTSLKTTASAGQIDTVFDQALKDSLAKVTFIRNPHEDTIKEIEAEATDTLAMYFNEAQNRLEKAIQR